MVKQFDYSIILNVQISSTFCSFRFTRKHIYIINLEDTTQFNSISQIRSNNTVRMIYIVTVTSTVLFNTGEIWVRVLSKTFSKAMQSTTVYFIKCTASYILFLTCYCFCFFISFYFSLWFDGFNVFVKHLWRNVLHKSTWLALNSNEMVHAVSWNYTGSLKSSMEYLCILESI